MPLPAIGYGALTLATSVASAVTAWVINDELEQQGWKSPSQTAPGVVPKAIVAGALVGGLIAGYLILQYKR
ncbi:MAG: hypothetical protein B6D76_17680 [gamma proteobacterium symbiont of Stewartia floridana]|nr:MAG: hypothetical protein B6D76_17680 [gamma proteobacterium symbiont of Stewartia floridana]